MAMDARTTAAACQTVAASCSCFALRKAARAVTQLFDAALRPAGLHSTQFSLLVALRLLGGVSVSRLAAEMVTDATTLTRNLAVLERRGLVSVVRGADRRTRVVQLTEKGEIAVAGAMPAWETTNRRLSGTLGAEPTTDLLRGLDTLTRTAVSGLEQRP